MQKTVINPVFWLIHTYANLRKDVLAFQKLVSAPEIGLIVL